MAPISPSSCDMCSALEIQLDDLNAKQEARWYLRSRVADTKDGDRNTKYFTTRPLNKSNATVSKVLIMMMVCVRQRKR